MSGLASNLQLPNITTNPEAPLSGFVKYFVRDGKLKVLTTTGEYDVVLQRPLDGFVETIPAPITSSDTVLSALEKISSSLKTITLVGDVEGSVVFNPDTSRFEIQTVINGNFTTIGIAVETVADRDAILNREWRMIVGVYNDPLPFLNGQYELVYNLVNTDINNNENWRNLNKDFFLFQNVSEGIITGEQHQIGKYIIPMVYEEIDGIFTKSAVKITLDTTNGTLRWYSNRTITKLIIILT